VSGFFFGGGFVELLSKSKRVGKAQRAHAEVRAIFEYHAIAEAELKAVRSFSPSPLLNATAVVNVGVLW
jgi:hypothetical protein